MANRPQTAPRAASKLDAREREPEREHEREHEREFHNERSALDEATHRELLLMHRESAEAILFAKNIQWRSVGAVLLVYGAFIAIASFTAVSKPMIDLLTVITIVLACGALFVLLMYQFWQLNEMHKMDEIARQFSSLFRRVARIKSRREGNIHRYTLLFFMIVVVTLGVIVVNVALRHVVVPPAG